MSSNWVRIPIGDEAQPYLSVGFTRTVLIVARTVTTTVWLLDFLPEILSDPRVQLLFTVEDEKPSVYHQGARDLLEAAEVATIPWAQAIATRFDLAICSTHTGSLERLQSPLLITPHGPGFGKPASVRPGGQVPRPCVSTDETGGRPRTTVVLSHPEQASLFAGNLSDVRLLVAGDPAYDRISASMRHRQRYRGAFGVQGGQRLVVLSSTWGPGAQLGRYPDLSLRLLRELPFDEYRVAMIIHPNIWFGHSTWQVRTWLKKAVGAGVMLVPPRGDSWRGAVVAADLLVADHGSVAFYAAAVGKPVLLASFGHEYLTASTPLAELGRLAPALDLDARLRPQIDSMIREHDPARYQPTVERMFASPGESLALMRAAIYELIGLDPPETEPRVLTVDQPRPELVSVTAHLVFGALDQAAADSSDPSVTLERYPAALTPPPPPPPPPPTRGCGTWSSTIGNETGGCSRAPRSSRDDTTPAPADRRYPTAAGQSGCSASTPAAGSPQPSIRRTEPQPCSAERRPRSLSSRPRPLTRQDRPIRRCSPPPSTSSTSAGDSHPPRAAPSPSRSGTSAIGSSSLQPRTGDAIRLEHRHRGDR